MVNFRRLLMVVALVAICSSMAMAVTNYWTAGSTTVTSNIPTILRQEGITETLAPTGIGFSIGQSGGQGYFTAAEADGTYNITLYFTGENVLFTSSNADANKNPEIQLVDSKSGVAYPCTVAANGTSASCPAVTLAGTFNGGTTTNTYAFNIIGIRVDVHNLPAGSLTPANGITLSVWAFPTTSNAGPTGLFASAATYTTPILAYAQSTLNVPAASYAVGTNADIPADGLFGAGNVLTAHTGKTPFSLAACQTSATILGQNVVAGAKGSDPFTAPTAANASIAIASINVGTLVPNAFKVLGNAATANTEAYGDSTGTGAGAGTAIGPWATNATRIAVTISGVPTGLTAYVPWKVVSSKQGDTTAVFATKLAADGSGPATLATNATQYFAVANGSTVFYEITAETATQEDDLNIPLVLVYTGTGAQIPTVTSAISATVQYAPFSTSSAVPRFSAASATTDNGIVAITNCATTLLFPYVTVQPGKTAEAWNTGIAIANTASDPFTTVGQSGICNLNFYGQDQTGAAKTLAVTFGAALTANGGDPFGSVTPISQGTVAAGVLTSPSAFGTGQFSGYAIAQCNFQYAHGYSFVIGNIGNGAFSNGYLALVLEGNGTATQQRPTVIGGQFESVTQ